MKFNKWTVGLAAVGVVSLASAVRADEKMSQVQTALSNTTISGYVDTSMQWVPGSGLVGAPRVAPVAFESGKSDGFNLNVVDLTLDKPLDESQWASGYHVDLWFGPDAASLGTANNVYKFDDIGSFTIGNQAAIRQAYIALRTPIGNGIEWKVGVFDNPNGYESTSDPLNPNYTRSYGYSIEPTELTGVLGTYKVNDQITLRAGMADTYLPMINTRAKFESQKTYLAGGTLTAPDSWGWLKGSTLDLGVINAVNSSANSSPNPPTLTLYSGGVTIPTPVKNLKAGAAMDYWQLHDAGNTVTHSDDSMWDVAFYGSYQATDKLSLHARVERLDAGSLSSQSGGYLPSSFYGSTLLSGNNGNVLTGLTGTVQYNLWANVLSRAEIRWDHANKFTPFGKNDSNTLMFALNLIYQF